MPKKDWIQTNVAIILDKFINEENTQDNVDIPKMQLKDNTLTLYDTRIAEKSGDQFWAMSNPTTDIIVKGQKNAGATETTNKVIDYLHEKLRNKNVTRVVFTQDYDKSLSALSPCSSASPSTADTNLTTTVDSSAPVNTVPNTPAAPSQSVNDPGFYRNVMISGTPGCGKSHFVDKHAIPAIVGTQNEAYCKEHTTRVVFTEGYTYEDFFGCYKPRKVKGTNGVTFDFAPGPFCCIACKALRQPKENFVLVIEEMNRGNAYEIFGNLFQLLDRHEVCIPQNAVMGQSVYPIALSVDAADWFNQQCPKQLNTDMFYIPQNLYIIATVNNADSRVHFMDTAMKRRFHAAYMNEEGDLYGTLGIPGISSYVPNNGQTTARHTQNTLEFTGYDNIRKAINKHLISDKQLEDKLIAKYFARMDANNKINHVDFIINVLGYLIQNVYRGRPLPSTIFVEPDCRSLGQLLNTYFMNGEKLDSILKISPDANENS